MHASSGSEFRESAAPPADERFREIRFRDLGNYIRILRASFSSGPGREKTVEALLRAAHLYRLLFFACKPLGKLGVLATTIPRIFVCEQDGQAVAAICIRRLGSADGPLYLVHLAVDVEYRRQGIATRLLSHVEGALPGQTAQLILTRVLESNEPQLRNRMKAGFIEYARQTRFTLLAESVHGTCTGLEREPDEVPALGNDHEFCLPSSEQMDELRHREAPAPTREIASSARREAGRSPFAHGVFPLTRRWRGGYCRRGRLVAGAVLFYHRLQHTYELDLVAARGAEDLARRLLHQARAQVRGDSAALNVTAHDHETAATAALRSSGLAAGERRILLCKRWSPPASQT